MRGLVIVLLALVAAASAGRRAPQRIVGGSLTDISQYPDMVSLLFGTGANNHEQFCGGVILNNRSILTAAHCPYGLEVISWWRSRVGSTFANSGGMVLNTVQIIKHPQYTPYAEDNDIGIIRVSGSIIFSNVIQPASIASYVVADNQVVWATGWGGIQAGGPASEHLRHVQVWTINQAECRKRYGHAAITDNMLCSGWLDVGGRDQCQGDSGGPLYHNGNVVGICSWGEGCADPYFPGVNARVSRFISWITQNA